MIRDTDFNSESDEERLQAEQDEALARRIRREVRRVQSGEADAEMEAEIEAERIEREEQQAAEREREARERRRAASPLRGLLTGNVLRQEWLTSNYRYPLVIAAIFLLSIIVMFWSLRLDMTYTRTEREVQLLRERAIRLHEQRSRRTTHSAIVEELQRRGIPLADPRTPPERLE